MGKLIDIEATELKNGNIEKISLVTSGAIRQGFKILKTEEIEERSTMRERIGKFFSGAEEHGTVAAFLVRKGAAKKWVPLIKKHGFRVEKQHSELLLEDNVVLIKQEGYDEDAEGSIIALNPDVAIQLTQVVKGFDPYPSSANFEENVKSAAFFPGLHNALASFQDTVFAVLAEAESNDDAVAAIAKQVKAFGSHVNNLVAELPSAVFKMEAESLTNEFAGSNVSPEDTSITNTEDSDMTTAVLKEAAAGDLDGLLDDAPAADEALAKAEEAAEEKVNEISADEDVEKGGDEGAPKSGGSPGNPVVESTSDTGAVSLDEGGVPAGFRKEERVLKQLEDGKLVEKTGLFFVNDETKEEIFGGFVEKAEEKEEVSPAEATSAADGIQYSAAELKLFESMNLLVKSVTAIKEKVESQDEQIAAISKTANDAKETAEDTVVMGIAADLDESLVSLAGSATVRKTEVEKGSGDPFAGLLPLIENNAA